MQPTQVHQELLQPTDNIKYKLITAKRLRGEIKVHT